MTLHGSYDILQGDCRERMAALPERHYHCCVTSPPYFGLRDYGCDGQIGLEPTPDDFVAAMVEVFRGVWRVLRDDGVVWLNLGETWRDKRKQFIPERTAIALQDDGWICRDTVIWHKPSPMPGSQRDRCTNAYEYIFQLVKGQWSDGLSPLPMRKEDAVWLAAMVDGEGCISLPTHCGNKHRRPQTWPTLVVHNTCVELLERCVEITGMGRVRERNDSRNRVCCVWSLAAMKCSRVLLAILPYLIAKKCQAEIALSVQWTNKYTGSKPPEDVQEYREKCRQALMALNHGHRPDMGFYRPFKQRKPIGCRYYFDMEAVLEPWADARCGASGVERDKYSIPSGRNGDTGLGAAPPYSGRTPRNVWTIPPEKCSEAHFATFPSAIPDKCIRASTSEKGCCPDCGAPWERIVERTAIKRDRPNEYVKRNGQSGTGNSCANTVAGVDAKTLGWQATCECSAGDPVPCRVIEPFCGAGTTLLAATRIGRDATGIELNPEYIEIARRRIERELRPGTTRDDRVIDSPLFTSTNGPNSGPIPVRLGESEDE